MTERVRSGELEQFAGNCLKAAGYAADEATRLAEILVWCDSIGRPNQGVWRLPGLCERVRNGGIRSPAECHTERVAPALSLLHGNGGEGHILAAVAAQEAIKLAREQGLGCVVVSDSNFCGAASYYVFQIAKAQMIGFCASNSFPKVVAHQGLRPVLGTNPLAFASPRANGEHLLVDMSTAASAGSTIRKHIEAGTLLPEGIAIDGVGLPIRDPKLVDQGALLPMAGAKGFGLGLMVEILAGVISGAGFSHDVASIFGATPGRNGHFLWALDIERLLPLAAYYERIEQLVGWVKESAPDGVTITYPGERRFQALDETSREGIPLDEPTVRSLGTLADALHVSAPFRIPSG